MSADAPCRCRDDLPLTGIAPDHIATIRYRPHRARHAAPLPRAGKLPNRTGPLPADRLCLSLSRPTGAPKKNDRRTLLSASFGRLSLDFAHRRALAFRAARMAAGRSDFNPCLSLSRRTPICPSPRTRGKSSPARGRQNLGAAFSLTSAQQKEIPAYAGSRHKTSLPPLGSLALAALCPAFSQQKKPPRAGSCRKTSLPPLGSPAPAAFCLAPARQKKPARRLPPPQVRAPIPAVPAQVVRPCRRSCSACPSGLRAIRGRCSPAGWRSWGWGRRWKCVRPRCGE